MKGMDLRLLDVSLAWQYFDHVMCPLTLTLSGSCRVLVGVLGASASFAFQHLLLRRKLIFCLIGFSALNC